VHRIYFLCEILVSLSEGTGLFTSGCENRKCRRTVVAVGAVIAAANQFIQVQSDDPVSLPRFYVHFFPGRMNPPEAFGNPTE
jgi:hypothetical protein